MVVLVGGGEGITENQPAPSEMAWLAGWGGRGSPSCLARSARDLVAPGLQNRFRRPPSTCSTLVRSGHHAGAVGMDGGGQVIQKQLIGEAATGGTLNGCDSTLAKLTLSCKLSSRVLPMSSQSNSPSAFPQWRESRWRRV